MAKCPKCDHELEGIAAAVLDVRGHPSEPQQVVALTCPVCQAVLGVQPTVSPADAAPERDSPATHYLHLLEELVEEIEAKIHPAGQPLPPD